LFGRLQYAEGGSWLIPQGQGQPDVLEHNNLAEWIGAETWNPFALDSNEVNGRLAGVQN
jgi:hypothetical protein